MVIRGRRTTQEGNQVAERGSGGLKGFQQLERRG